MRNRDYIEELWQTLSEHMAKTNKPTYEVLGFFDALNRIRLLQVDDATKNTQLFFLLEDYLERVPAGKEIKQKHKNTRVSLPEIEVTPDYLRHELEKVYQSMVAMQSTLELDRATNNARLSLSNVGFFTPSAVSKHTEEQFKKAQTGSKSYEFIGSEEYKPIYINGIFLSPETMIADRIRNTNERVFYLDEGTAAGAFPRRMNKQFENVHAFGITAEDMRGKKEKTKNDPNYIIGDIQELDKTLQASNLQGQEFNIISSATTYIHLADPASAMIQAYNRLKIDGVLVIDILRLRGCEDRLEDFLQYLKSQGHHVVADIRQGEIKGFAIQKTKNKPFLDLPLTRVLDEKQITYQISPAAQLKDEQRKAILQNNFDQGLKVVKQKIDALAAQNPLVKELMVEKELKDLFKNSTYQQLKPSDQFFLMMYVAGKSFSVNDYPKEAKQLWKELNNREVNEDKRRCIERILNNQDFSVLGAFVGSRSFQELDSKTQLELLAFVVQENMVRIGRGVETHDVLEKMGIPNQMPRFMDPVNGYDPPLTYDTQLIYPKAEMLQPQFKI